MKRNIIISSIAALLVAASCAQVEEIAPGQAEAQIEEKNPPVTFSAGVGVNSKTSINEDKTVSWAAGDKLTVFDSEGKSEEFIVEEDCDKFTFTTTGTIGKGPYYAIAGYGSDTPAFDASSKKISISRPGSTTGGSFGEADLIASTTSGDSFSFHHVFALLKMSIASDEIKSLTFNAEGITTTGAANIGFKDDGSLDVEYDKSGNSVTINNINSAGTYYAAVNPGTYSGGFTILVNYETKRMKIASEKAFTASVGKSINFGTLDSGTPESTVWTLVTNASDLSAGDEVIIAAGGYDYAIGTNQKNNNRAAAAISKSSDKTTLAVAPGSDVQVFTLTSGSSSGTFGFYTGAGYIYAASSSSNYLKTQTKLDANASWKITVSGSSTSITAQGSNSRKVLQYNPNNGSPLFSCYASASQKAVVIYKKVTTPGSGPQMSEVSSFLDETELGVYSYDAAPDITLPVYQYCLRNGLVAAGKDQIAVSTSGNVSFRLQCLAEGLMAAVKFPVPALSAGTSYSVESMFYGIGGIAEGSSTRNFTVKKTADGKAWLLEDGGTTGLIISTK